MILVWDLPALVSTFFLNWQMLKELNLATDKQLEESFLSYSSSIIIDDEDVFTELESESENTLA